jgi:hypothetical protein
MHTSCITGNTFMTDWLLELDWHAGLVRCSDSWARVASMQLEAAEFVLLPCSLRQHQASGVSLQRACSLLLSLFIYHHITCMLIMAAE